MPQTPEYTVRLRTPHEHQREKETPEPLTSAKASGKGMLPVWRRSPAIVAPTSSLYLERVMNLGENRIEMRIPRSVWFP
jgi:hypothetical protein